MHKRLYWLDALRGIAALLVCLTHILDALSDSFVLLRHTVLQTGQIGVIAFFACSGFIIPGALARQPNLAGFWIGRFFRLVPLYWLSVGAAVALIGSGRMVAPAAYTLHPLQTLLANLTMAPSILGSAPLLGVYWTLTQELLFYAVLSGVFVAGLERFPTPLAVGFLGASVAAVLVRPDLVGTPTSGNFLLYLGIMWGGAAVAQVDAGRVHPGAGYMVGLLGLGALSATLLGRFSLDVMLPVVIAQVLGLGLFVAFYLKRHSVRMQTPAALGRISYGLYLLHPLVIALIPPFSHPIVTAVVWLGASIAIAMLTERWVERPSIALGRRIAAERIGRHVGAPHRIEAS